MTKKACDVHIKVKTQSTMQHMKGLETVYPSHLQAARSTPFPDVRHTAANRGEYCQPPVDSLGSGQGLTYDPFLMDFLKCFFET